MIILQSLKNKMISKIKRQKKFFMTKSRQLKKLKKSVRKIEKKLRYQKPYKIFVDPTFDSCDFDYSAFEKAFGQIKLYTTVCVTKNFKCRFFKFCKIKPCDEKCEKQNLANFCYKKIIGKKGNLKKFIVACGEEEIEKHYLTKRNVPVLYGNGKNIRLNIPEKNKNTNNETIDYDKLDELLNMEKEKK